MKKNIIHFDEETFRISDNLPKRYDSIKNIEKTCDLKMEISDFDGRIAVVCYDDSNGRNLDYDILLERCTQARILEFKKGKIMKKNVYLKMFKEIKACILGKSMDILEKNNDHVSEISFSVEQDQEIRNPKVRIVVNINMVSENKEDKKIETIKELQGSVLGTSLSIAREYGYTVYDISMGVRNENTKIIGLDFDIELQFDTER